VGKATNTKTSKGEVFKSKDSGGKRILDKKKKKNFSFPKERKKPPGRNRRPAQKGKVGTGDRPVGGGGKSL